MIKNNGFFIIVVMMTHAASLAQFRGPATGFFEGFNDIGAPQLSGTDFATSNNNDHVISFDGKQMAISHHAEEDNRQSYLHGWSADDKYLVYCAVRTGLPAPLARQKGIS